MIKCFGFGKLLKQLFIISLISFFGLLGSSFVNADWIFQDVGTSFTVSGQSTYTLNPRPSGAGIVEGAGVIVPAFYVPKRWSSYQYYSLFYYNTDGYMVKNSYQNKYPSQSKVYQVVFDSFYLTTPENLSNCSSAFPCGGISTNYDTYRNNANYKGKMTRFAYYYSSNSNYESSICLIFDSFDSAFCFYNNQNYIAGDGLTTNPVEFDTSLVGNSPRVTNQGGIISGPTTGNDSVFTGDYIYGTCTYDQIIEYAESQGMTKNLCYGGLDNRDNLSLTGIYNPVPGTGKMLDDIYSYTKDSGQGANDWFLYRRQVYQNPYLYSNNVWTSKPAVLKTYFDFYSTYNGYAFDFNTVYEYCLLVKFSSWGNGDSIYNGQYFKKTCDFLDNGGRDDYGSGLVGKVPNGTNWNGVGNLSGTTNYNNGVNFIQDIFNRLKANFPTKYDIGLGFLPAYIIVFLCAIILFRFISH